MDDAHASNIDEWLQPGAPFVVIFFRNGDDRRLGARIRDVRSQEQWLASDAEALRDLLRRPQESPEP